MCNGLTIANDRRYLRRYILGFLTGLCAFALSPGGEIPTVSAQGTNVPPVLANARAHAAPPRAAQRVSKPYYIEFRARNAQSYGHTFSIFGRLNAQGKIVSSEVAGLHPFTESPLPWMLGHLIMVPSETGASDGDTEDQYVLARFRVVLSEDEYQRVTTYIRQLQASSPTWHAALYNCNAFVGDIARFMGLRVPASHLSLPETYINAIRDANMGRAGQAGVIGTPVRVEDPAALRASALRAIAKRENAAKPKSAAASAN
jgi:hypothetical protein